MGPELTTIAFHTVLRLWAHWVHWSGTDHILWRINRRLQIFGVGGADLSLGEEWVGLGDPRHSSFVAR